MVRSISGTRNRALLATGGIITLTTAAWLGSVFVTSRSALAPFEAALPQGESTVAGIAAEHQQWLLPVVAVLVLIAAVAGLVILLWQVPRHHPSVPLHIGADTPGHAGAKIAPSVLARALTEQAEALAPVLDCDVHVHGVVADLRVQALMTVAADADIAWTVAEVRQLLAHSITIALGEPPRSTHLQVRTKSPGKTSRPTASAAATDAPRAAGREAVQPA
jgi:hypothetical protein